MRQLTAAELELISGGDGSENEIVVTGSPYPSPSPQPMPGAPWPGQYPGSPSPSPTGGGGVPYTPAGNAWANSHISLIGTTQADVHAYNVMHTDLAKFYDFATKNPNALIQIGNGQTVTAATALQDFNSIMVDIQSTGGGPNGGIFTPNGTGGGVITFNPENSTLSSEYSSYGDSIYNYGIFHELGHELDNANAQSLYNSTNTEGYANTAGRSMEQDVGLTLVPFPSGSPPGGYK